MLSNCKAIASGHAKELAVILLGMVIRVTASSTQQNFIANDFTLWNRLLWPGKLSGLISDVHLGAPHIKICIGSQSEVSCVTTMLTIWHSMDMCDRFREFSPNPTIIRTHRTLTWSVSSFSRWRCIISFTFSLVGKTSSSQTKQNTRHVKSCTVGHERQTLWQPPFHSRSR